MGSERQNCDTGAGVQLCTSLTPLGTPEPPGSEWREEEEEESQESAGCPRSLQALPFPSGGGSPGPVVLDHGLSTSTAAELGPTGTGTQAGHRFLNTDSIQAPGS